MVARTSYGMQFISKACFKLAPKSNESELYAKRTQIFINLRISILLVNFFQKKREKYLQKLYVRTCSMEPHSSSIEFDLHFPFVIFFYSKYFLPIHWLLDITAFKQLSATMSSQSLLWLLYVKESVLRAASVLGVVVVTAVINPIFYSDNSELLFFNLPPNGSTVVITDAQQ